MGKSGIWDKLANIGVGIGLVEIKDSGSDSVVQEPIAPVAKVSPVSMRSSAPAVDPQLISHLDKAARDQLINAMASSGAALVEELEGMLDTLKENISDEPSRYKAALKILARQGNPLVAIRQDFDKCIGALETTQREFEKNLSDQLNRRVGAKHQVVADCNAQMKAKQAEISRLQEEVAALGATAHEAQSSISDEQSKLDTAKERFTLCYETLRTEIESHSTKVSQYGEGL